ncbi:hypothetical protein LCGC14_0976130 [marine sediment metagenome]|uniref:Uncharacterized protein n=1 Tax=marine sediment metagenome TaxID=412755 RepID=A0A0F9NA39_9ZZZZ
MSDPNADDKKKGDPSQPREPSGKFTSKTKPDSTVQSQPKESEYTKMNSFMAKQLGLSDKLADLQTKHDPKDLFQRLSFMSENTSTWEKESGKGGLPPNKPVAPITPGTEKFDLPGKQLSTPNLTKQNFSVHYKIPFKEIIGKKEK